MTEAAPEPSLPRAPPSEQSAASARRRARVEWAKRGGRLLLLAAGIVAVVLLVLDAGPGRVLATLVAAGIWLPAIALLECAFMAMDVVALRGLLGSAGREVPLLVWVRSGFVQYGVMQLLPAGRAGGEVARAAALAPFVGGARAAAAATRLQGATMLANTVISIPCWAAVALTSGPGEPLAWAVLANAGVTGAIAAVLILAARRSSVGGWLGRRIRLLAAHGPSFDAALREQTPWTPAVIATSVGRTFQTVQYGLILLAVGGALTVPSALIAQGIHLVGAGMGDMVPNQVGITEGAYALFARALPLDTDPLARAIAIALVARICQFSLAGASLVVSSLWKIAPPAGAPAGEASALPSES